MHEVLGHRAVRLDVDGRQVEIDDGTVLTGDAVVLATGASPRHLPGTEGLGAAGRPVHPAHARRLAGPARRADGRRVVPGRGDRCRVHRCRGGLDLCRTGLPGHRDRGDGDPPVQRAGTADRCALRLAARGPRRRPAHRGRAWPASVAPRDRRGRAWSSSSRTATRLEADVVVVGIGVVPSVDWLKDSGLTLENGVVCDDRLFAADGIVAAGDVARWMWRHDGGEEQIRIEHWQVAAEAGVAAARSAPGRSAPRRRRSRPIPYFWSDQFGIRFQVLGQSRRERRGRDRRAARSKRASSSPCSAGPVACGPSWPSAGRAS